MKQWIEREMSDMQAIIMAAGKGSRIEHLTKGYPKSFLEIHGKKLIERNIDLLHKYGIWDITIVIGYRDDAFRDLTKDMPGIKLVYNPFYEMMNVIGSFWMGMDILQDDFIYMHADTICEESLFRRLLQQQGDIVLPVDTKSSDEEAMKVKTQGSQVVEITKKMPANESVGEFIGIAKLRKQVLDELKEKTTDLMRDKIFNEYFESAIQRLIDEKNFDIRMMDTQGAFWAEIDFEEDYEQAKNGVSCE